MTSKLLILILLCSAAANAQLATPVSITSVTCSAGTCTVLTSAAHHVPSNDPGFCILSSSVTADNVCGAAATVADTTHFTVTSASMATCSSSCGTAQPAPVLMVRSTQPQAGFQTVTACFWTYVTTGVPISGATSSCHSNFSGALQTQVDAAIAAGNFVEYVQTVSQSNSATLGTIQQYYQALQFSYQLQALQPGGFSGHQCDVTGCN